MIISNLQLRADRVCSPKRRYILNRPAAQVLSGTITGDSTVKQIPLTQGKRTTVDDEDYSKLSKHKWCVSQSYCGDLTAIRRKGNVIIRMHRVIMNASRGMDIDHINHDTLDNRRCNLRICTRSQNQQNQLPLRGKTSRYKGVCFYKRDGKWQAYIKLNGKRYHLGYFNNEVDAAKAYDVKAKEFFGEFAYSNFGQIIATAKRKSK